MGSISNRGRNYEPARLRSFCGQQNLKSHGVPRLMGGACRCMAAHVLRLPRLTLKAGRKAGCKAGSLRDGRARSRQNAKIKIRKIEISKIANSQKSKSPKLSSQFFPRDRSRNCFPQDHNLVFKISGKTFASSSPCARFVTREVHT